MEEITGIIKFVKVKETGGFGILLDNEEWYNYPDGQCNISVGSKVVIFYRDEQFNPIDDIKILEAENKGIPEKDIKVSNYKQKSNDVQIDIKKMNCLHCASRQGVSQTPKKLATYAKELYKEYWGE